MIDKDVIKLQQERILNSIFEEKTLSFSPSLTLLKELKNFHPSILTGTLGTLGQKLLRFSEAIDLKNPHPDMATLCNGALIDGEGSFIRVVVDLLDVKEFCASNSVCSYVSESLTDVAYSHPSRVVVDETIDDPESNLQNIRFVKSRKLRDQIRSHKDWQLIGLNPLAKKEEGEYVWDCCPDGFEVFARGNNVYARDVEEAKHRIDHMRKFGLDSMAQEIEAYLISLEQKVAQESYFGFNSISLPTTAVILGKQIGVEFSVTTKPYQTPNLKATISKDWCNGSFEAEWSSLPSIEYKPRCYPLCDVWQQTPDEAKKVVDHLEKFPDSGGKALFDHYRVVVPSFPFSKVGIDLLMIEMGRTVGVLLGERDGQHYFICYWGV